MQRLKKNVGRMYSD